MRGPKLHQSSCWRSSPPCSYVVDPHLKLRLQFLATYCPHFLYSEIDGRLTRLRKKKNPVGIVSSHYRKIKYIFMPVQRKHGTKLGMGWEQRERQGKQSISSASVKLYH